MCIYTQRYLVVDLGSRVYLYHRVPSQKSEKVKKWKNEKSEKKRKFSKFSCFQKLSKKCSLHILLVPYCSEMVFLDRFWSKMKSEWMNSGKTTSRVALRFPNNSVSDSSMKCYITITCHWGIRGCIFEQNWSKNTVSEQYGASSMSREHFLNVFENMKILKIFDFLHFFHFFIISLFQILVVEPDESGKPETPDRLPGSVACRYTLFIINIVCRNRSWTLESF